MGLPIVLFEEAVDRGLKVGDGSNDAALRSALCAGCEEAGEAEDCRDLGDGDRPVAQQAPGFRPALLCPTRTARRA